MEKTVPFLVLATKTTQCALGMANVISLGNAFVQLALLDQDARQGALVQQRHQQHHAMKTENALLTQQQDVHNAPAMRDS